MKKRKKQKRKLKKGALVGILVFLVIVVLILLFVFVFNNDSKTNSGNSNNNNQVMEHYSEFVKTNKETSLYDEDGDEVGKIGKDVELTLKDIDVSNDTIYFPISDLDGYYIKYDDVSKLEVLSEVSDRYLNYIPFNLNVKTGDVTSFYDENDNLIYEFNESFDLPIIIKDDDKYGVEFNNRLMYVNSEGTSTYDNHNTDETNASGVGVLNYHAFYDDDNPDEAAACTTAICHSKSQFKEQLDFLKENNILTLKMDELDMYIDGKLQLPKSVVITIDDGQKTRLAVDMLTEYEMYATIFMVTSRYDVSEYYVTDYIELHSHTDDLHDGGYCPGGQGSAIKCLEEDVIQADLQKSREALNGADVFCFPFYEYNDYAIEMVKEAGFKMAFIGESGSSDNLVHVGDDKFTLRRFVIVTYTTINDLENYFGQIY